MNSTNTTLLLVFLIICMKLTCYADNWKLIDVGDHPSSNYMSIDCADINNCMAFGNVFGAFKAIRRTTDGGKTWENIYNDTLDTPILPAKAADIAYPDTSLVLALCDTCLVLRSTDKGVTWTEKRLNCKVNDYTWTGMKIKTYGKKFGVVRTNSEIFVTTDGGELWSKKNIILNDLPDSINWVGWVDLSLPDSNTIITTGYIQSMDAMFIIYSTDRGETWACHPPKDPGFKFGPISFLDLNHGWALYSRLTLPGHTETVDRILYTSDGGISWKIQMDTILQISIELFDLQFLDSLNGVAWGGGQRVYHTTNAGKKWERVEVKYPDVDCEFKDIKMLVPDRWLAASRTEMKIYEYNEKTDIKDDYTSPDDLTLAISPNILNVSESFRINIELNNYSRVRFHIINSAGEIIDVSDSYYLKAGSNQIEYSPNNLFSSGMYWMQVVIEDRQRYYKPFIIK